MTEGGPPRDFQALREAIARRADGLPRRLAQVASYALENPDEIAFGTVASIAASAAADALLRRSTDDRSNVNCIVPLPRVTLSGDLTHYVGSLII